MLRIVTTYIHILRTVMRCDVPFFWGLLTAVHQVPCYKLNMIAVMVFTHVWLLTGWIGSLQSGFLFEDSSWNSFVENLGRTVRSRNFGEE